MIKGKSKESVKPITSKYRHIFFDLDHTLWDFDANAKESLSELYEYFSLEARFVSPFELFYNTYLEKLAKEMSAKFLEILPTKKRVFEYTFEILDYLTEKGYSIHLITNGFEKTQWSKLNNSRLAGYFTHVITSEASNSMKPQKEIFDYAVRKANGHVSECIMIGDNPAADIKGAINAGMDTIFVNHGKTDPLPESTYIIFHLKELESIF
jgi:putative hydrolase of the HAD superfamily